MPSFLIHPVLNKVPRLLRNGDFIRNMLRSDMNVFVQGMAATPTFLTNAMTEWGVSQKLSNIKVYHMHTEGLCPYIQEKAQPHFTCRTFFVGKNVRDAVNQGIAEYVPCLMNDVPRFFRRRIIPLDVALVQMSPPDNHGVCSLGPSVETTLAAMETAKHVVCQINRNLPRTQGDALVHINNVDAIVETDTPLYTTTNKAPSVEDQEIGRLITTHLIPDGATLQLGIGNIPNMVLDQLHSHKNLGIHSEMFSDGVVQLVQEGVINNSKKTVDPGRLVVSFLVGSPTLFDFVHNNPMVEMRDVAYTNNPCVIMRQDNMIAVNSAIEVDLTGQVCSDSIGTRIYSGFGGQLDFMYGSSLSNGGKSIIALHSRTSHGKPRLVPMLHNGAGVVTTRAHVNYVVTEYGIVSLCGLSMNERARKLIQIAHPEDRDMLTLEARKRNLI